jgi:hypothetical protein
MDGEPFIACIFRQRGGLEIHFAGQEFFQLPELA